MAEFSMRKIVRNDEDRISELPLHLQQTILCFLPIQDAVRTSVLSTKWRHCWTTLPHIIFDHRFSMFEQVHQYDDSQVKTYKLFSVINKVLLLHKGPILKFSLTFPPIYYCDAQIVHEFVDQWIPLFSRNGTKQLILQEYDELGENTPHSFSSLDLTHLRFTRGLFPYTPAFGGYTNLRILELVYLNSDLGESIYDCPALEKLTLIYCRAIFPIHFRAPKLKCLRQAYHELTVEYALPGLENLTEYSCLLAEHLEELEDTTSQTKTSNVVKVLGSLDKIEKFSTGVYFLTYLAAGGSPNRLSKPLPYLKTLNMCDIHFADMSEVSCLLCLIRSAPNLCKLNLTHCMCNREENLKNYRIEDSKDFTIDHLEIVTFSYFRGLRAELELIKFLLGHSPLLKTMSIHLSPYVETDAAYAMAGEILQYPRASSRVEMRDLERPFTISDFDFDIELWRHLFFYNFI